MITGITLLLAGLIGSVAFAAPPEQDFSRVTIKTTKVAGSVSMLEGSGGNIGVSVGADGVVMIDDEFAPLVPKIRAAVAQLSKSPLRFLINTHWHGDHTGGNPALAQAGATIIAHENVRKRLSTGGTVEAFHVVVPAQPNEVLPAITFADDVTVHLNGEDIHVIHVPAAHTDSDAIVHFKKSNVIHMGDTFFNGFYPFFDTGSGGSIDGMIAAEEKGLALADANTKIIPGHGPLGDRAALQAAHDMLVQARAAILKTAKGKNLALTIEAKPTAPWDAKWGKGMLPPEVFVTTVYNSSKH